MTAVGRSDTLGCTVLIKWSSDIIVIFSFKRWIILTICNTGGPGKILSISIMWSGKIASFSRKLSGKVKKKY